jgi:hypothetical protein
VPDYRAVAFVAQDALNSFGQDLAALTTRQVLLRADALPLAVTQKASRRLAAPPAGKGRDGVVLDQWLHRRPLVMAAVALLAEGRE